MSAKKWSAEVMRRSNALDLEDGVFTKKTSLEVARSLKDSADASSRRKAPPMKSAMSMLSFHINRSGKRLSSERRRVLEGAKTELRRLYAGRTKKT